MASCLSRYYWRSLYLQLNLILTDTVGSFPQLKISDHNMFVELNYVCADAGSAKAFIHLHMLSPLDSS